MRAALALSLWLAVAEGAMLLIGVMSVARDTERRAAMRETWVADAAAVAPSLRTRFVLGRAADAAEADAIARENATHGDLVVLPCDENQHNGKTLHWFWHAAAFLTADGDGDGGAAAAAGAAPRFDFVAKMDQDAYVWPAELHAHVQGFARASFYGGSPWTHARGNRHLPARAMEHVNGGFVVLSADLARAAARVAAEQSAAAPPAAAARGFLDAGGPHASWVRQNEDVSLAVLVHRERPDLRANRGDFPWAAGGARPGGDKDAHSLCPWRHAKDLKEAANYREQHARRGERVCRGNVCPWAMRSVGEASDLERRRTRDPRFDEMEAWKTRMKAQQRAQGYGGIDYSLPPGLRFPGEAKPPAGGLVDEREECAAWAARGECDANPGYMRASCKRSCAGVGRTEL